jgi:hypothetical protein
MAETRQIQNRLYLRVVNVYVRLVSFKIPALAAILEDGAWAANSK